MTEQRTPDQCAQIGDVIYCQCGKPSSHYATMGERGAREVKNEPPPALRTSKTMNGALARELRELSLHYDGRTRTILQASAIRLDKLLDEFVDSATELRALVRRIEMICDATGRDPLEYLADHSPDETSERKPFPVLGYHACGPECPQFVLWHVLSEEWAQRNHSQSLETLASRGGLAPAEIVANMEHRPFRRMRVADAVHQIKPFAYSPLKASGKPCGTCGDDTCNGQHENLR